MKGERTPTGKAIWREVDNAFLRNGTLVVLLDCFHVIKTFHPFGTEVPKPGTLIGCARCADGP